MLNIDKRELNEAWANKEKSDKFYKMLYKIAEYQAKKEKINKEELEDFIQFAMLKCYNHVNSYNPKISNAYSFFWKQIYLAIVYKKRKDAKQNTKIKSFFVDQEKILDVIEQQTLKDSGEKISDLVEKDEAKLLLEAFKLYNKNNEIKATNDKEGAKKVILWIYENDPEYIEKFKSLKYIFKSWIKKETVRR